MQVNLHTELYRVKQHRAVSGIGSVPKIAVLWSDIHTVYNSLVPRLCSHLNKLKSYNMSDKLIAWIQDLS